jgi:putative exporter of polyketide antibiotics
MENKEENRAIKRVEKRIDKLTRRMEESGLCEFIDYSSARSRVLWSNAIQRLAVTLRIITGNAVVIAFIIFFANKAARTGVSLFAEYIADLIELVRVHHPG